MSLAQLSYSTTPTQFFVLFSCHSVECMLLVEKCFVSYIDKNEWFLGENSVGWGVKYTFYIPFQLVLVDYVHSAV